MNNITITGNLTSRPDFYENENFCKITFRVADNYYQGKDKDKGTNFTRCTLLGVYGKVIKESMDKGTQVTVYGELRTDVWKNEEGENVRSPYVFVSNISLPKKDAE